ncbi:Averantin hydroxylase [Lasiodiplodia theobromae]|uniref:Averantin hydroxylase n=1 Tax=Lasiodiplodia theobromae TaxID=45133 RepID=A0A5N5CTI1_9PEZI|nr:Averantin hydroxylase [Lasiodiplodia theobromae]
MDPENQIRPLAKPVLACAFPIFIIALIIYRLYLHPLSKYPGPKYAAVSGLVYWYVLVRGDLAHWYHRMHEQYGEVVRVGPNKLSFINPQAWKDIYGHKVGAAAKKAIMKDPASYPADDNGERNIAVILDDREHSAVRKVFTNAFSDKALKQQESLIQGYVDKLVKNLYATAGQETDMIKNYNCTTFDIMGDLAFGEPLGLLDNSEYSPWVKAIFNGIKAGALMNFGFEYSAFGALSNLLLPRSLREKKAMHFQYSVDRVERRLEKGDVTDKPDFWTLVLSKGKDVLTRPKMHANSSAFMIAGTETTATLLSGLTYYLLKNPEAMAKVVREVRALGSEDELNLETLQRLPYLHACFEEAFRCYPPVPVGLWRLVTGQGTPVCGEWLPAGTRVTVPQWASYRSPRNFKDPERFIPERWLPDSGFETDRKDALQPFSTGPRNCLGKNLAYHEMRIMFAKVLWHFDLQLSPRSENWADQKVWTLWDKPDLFVTLKPVMRE